MGILPTRDQEYVYIAIHQIKRFLLLRPLLQHSLSLEKLLLKSRLFIARTNCQYVLRPALKTRLVKTFLRECL